MKPSEYKWSEWIRATWRSKVFEWKAGDFFGDEWADGIATLETANAELLEALKNLSGAVHAVGYDTVSIIHPALLNANEAIRKHKGEGK